jgi:hypothetical protein
LATFAQAMSMRNATAPSNRVNEDPADPTMAVCNGSAIHWFWRVSRSAAPSLGVVSLEYSTASAALASWRSPQGRAVR